MEQTKIGIFIGATAFIIAIFAFIAAAVLRSGRSKSFGWFRILFYMLIFATGVMYLAGTAALLDIIVNGKWDRIGLPLSLLVPAIALTVVLPRIRSELNKRS